MGTDIGMMSAHRSRATAGAPGRSAGRVVRQRRQMSDTARGTPGTANIGVATTRAKVAEAVGGASDG
jgi:hypothetical protein